MTENKWHFISFVFRNSDGLRLVYLDGVDISDNGPNATSTPSGLSSTMKIGTNVKGMIDDVRIYNKAFSEEEIEQLYESGKLHIEVKPKPAAPTATKSPNAATVCVGQTLSLTGVSSGSGGAGTCNVQYRYSTNGGSSYTGWSTSLPSFAATGTNNIIQIRRNCTGSGCESDVNTYTWAVVPDPSITAQPASMGTICAGGASTAVSVSASGGTPSLAYQWQYYNGSSWQNVSNGTPAGATYSNGTLASNFQVSGITAAGTYQYRCRVSATGSGCDAINSNTTTLKVDPASVGGSVSGGTTPICLGSSTGNMTLSGHTGTTVRWQKRLGGGSWTNITNTNTTYSETPTSAGTWEYRAEVKSGVCVSAYSSTRTIIVDPASVGGSVTGGTTPICLGSSTGTMTLSGHTGTIVRWQKRVGGGSWTNITNTSTTYSEVPSSAGTWEYRAEVKSGVCASAYSSTRTIIVDPASVGGSVSGGTTPICLGSSTGTMTLSGHTGTIVRWQKRVGGGSWTNISNTSTTYSEVPNSAGTWEYRAEVKSGVCASAYSSTRSIVVDANPIAGSISATPIGDLCAGTFADLELSGNTGTIQWQTNASGSWVDITGATSTSYTTPVLTATTSYQAVVSNGVCSSANASHTINVTTPSTSGLASNDYVWTGTINTNWNNTTNENWLVYSGSNFSIPSNTPSASSNVFIRKTASCFTGVPEVSTVNEAECNNLTIDANNNLDLVSGGTLAINGNLSNAGTLSMAASGNSNIEIKGAWNNEYGTFNAGSGTVTFNGTNNMQVIKAGNSPFNNIVFNNTAQGFNITQATTINGNAIFTNGIVNFTTNGVLNFSAGSSSNEGTANSFANGEVSKIGTTAFTFPVGQVVGDDNIWAPIGIAAPSSSSTITAQYNYYPGPLNWSAAYMCNQEELHHTSGVEHWLLSSNGVHPAVTLYWKDGTRSGITNLNDLRVAHWTGTCWKNKGSQYLSGSADEGSITSSVGFTSYSPITFGTFKDTNPLPVELINFTANCNEGIVNLNWTTATEINNDYFEIDRSRDALTWVKFAEIEGAGNSNLEINYEYDDVHPGNGTIYYRLLQVDYDGTSKYSDIIQTICVEPVSIPVISVYPNPFKDIFTLQIDNWDMNELEFEVLDLLGQKLLERKFQNVDNNIITNINLRDIAPAMYILKIKTSEGVVVKKIEKK